MLEEVCWLFKGQNSDDIFKKIEAALTGLCSAWIIQHPGVTSFLGCMCMFKVYFYPSESMTFVCSVESFGLYASSADTEWLVKWLITIF